MDFDHLKLQSTPDNSNLQWKSQSLSYREFGTNNRKLVNKQMDVLTF